MNKNKISRRRFLGQAAGSAVLAGLPGLGSTQAQAKYDYQLVVRGATIVDGTGAPGYTGDIAVRQGRIFAIGKIKEGKSYRTIEANGLVASPGFIDIHTHTDTELLKYPRGESKLRQGVTTEIGGNCGGSPFPSAEGTVAGERWASLRDFLSELEKAKIGLNFATFVGQGAVRRNVLQDANRKPTSDELTKMKQLVATAMRDGAVGISSGLEYTPSGFAEADELIELCKAAQTFGGIYATHMRNEDDRLLEAIQEAIEVARAASIPLQISHLKAAGRANWSKTDQALALIEEGVRSGVSIHADRYPYIAYATGLSINFPKWARDGGNDAFVARLRDMSQRARMKGETEAKVRATDGWESLLIAGVRTDANRTLVGRRIAEVALEKGFDPFHFACDLLVEENGSVSTYGFAMDEEGTAKVLAHRRVMIASDGNALSPARTPEKGGLSRPHPRSYGTFPRVFAEYVRKRKTLTLEQAVQKMTGLVSNKLGWPYRGRLLKDQFADIVLFDATRIADRATFTESEQFPEGIEYVIVNGTPAVEKNSYTESPSGVILVGHGRRV
ncbi:MAG: N-acyl-D-amino-acid deacylase family protein [Acidobacteriota bacterium]